MSMKQKRWKGFQAPPMPWDDDPEAPIFPSLAKRYGSAYALRMWGYVAELASITGDTEHTEEWRQEALRTFIQWMQDEHPEDCAGFSRLLRLVRVYEAFGAFKASSRLVGGSRQHLRPIRRAPLQIRRLSPTRPPVAASPEEAAVEAPQTPET